MSVFTSYLSDKEEKTLFGVVKKTDCIFAKRDYYWMLLARETAIRLGVLAGPDPKKSNEKDLPQIGLTIGNARESLTEGYLVYNSFNNKRLKQHPIKLSNSAKEALTHLITIHNQIAKNWIWDIPEEERPLVLGRIKGKGLSRIGFQKRTKQWMELAGISKGSFHWFRHTWAKRYIARSTAADALIRVQAVLGHADARTVSNYLQPDKADIAQAMEEASSCRK